MLENTAHDNYIFAGVTQEMQSYKIPLNDNEKTPIIILFRNLKFILTLIICYFNGKLVNLCPVFMQYNDYFFFRRN